MLPGVSIEQRTSARCNRQECAATTRASTSRLNRAAHFRALQRSLARTPGILAERGLNRAAHFRALQRDSDEPCRDRVSEVSIEQRTSARCNTMCLPA